MTCNDGRDFTGILGDGIRGMQGQINNTTANHNDSRGDFDLYSFCLHKSKGKHTTAFGGDKRKAAQNALTQSQKHNSVFGQWPHVCCAGPFFGATPLALAITISTIVDK